ncbi:aromatic ring-hydroxylating dioxygenase subunit alpha [Aestuariicella hydrocarbonica]|uniref:Aromatic ring-hydroxylating dioxygenase subunit alpha n=1 Tax=Pseudomaricurvus hydrocarbonicus TaxID=1470433 RepID=A0A9E5JTB7_9GAMM|nr:aromatic ring-hydroxylating dioxygenase subunit alpha [Aestuariicella hydrocarbonica]NHO66164.1 aromatic ring-hydroxylating dioxygenase subunit alpha [Aestuariicella hydrocarbonica]
MSDNNIIETVEELTEAATYNVDAYISEDYARAERDNLWRKVWLQVGRVEEIPEVGNYITYDIKDDSVIIVRSGPDTIQAFHNVCPHRGRRLVDTPKGERNARGKRAQFICAYHGWRFGPDGKNTHIGNQDDWNGALDGCSDLNEVKLDTWGGWIWINLNSDCEPLSDYLNPVPEMLEPFQLQNMRYRWRKWGVFDCNWKVALEAFNETYHVQQTHPEFNKYGEFRGWAKAHGKHSNIGYEAPKNMDQNQSAKLRLGTNADPRISTAEMQVYTWEKANTNTTQTLVDAALRLKDELPEGTPPGEVLQHWLSSARKDDEARGVFWPEVDPAHVGKSGTAWQIFPNFQIGHAVNNMLCYSARPYGDDPNKCIFEAAVYELFPEGEEPDTQWQFGEATEEDWCYVLSQDFSNMAAVQQGMKSMGFTGPKPNPYMERSTANLHRNLAEYMGTGELHKLKK